MKFVLVFGPQAVEKMTVGQELSSITDLKLFHNHMTIDMLVPFFDFGPDMWKLSTLFREEIFKHYAKGDKYGMIFTYVWAFNEREDRECVENICNIFSSQGGDIYFVELEANVEERLKRNKTPNRLEQKPRKRNIKQSEENLLNSMDTYRLNSEQGEIKQENYVRINNTNLSADEVARMIKKEFML
ncbi:AAA family ATPase [Gracilibacillus caseinilyticus]|uniref:AAA family ATPase n=1 Tax=Gracilibacillus caseinilyticus TaxID=2932256 RepID=A0ABY4ER07_9BACI|nr:AAA family ATPase [Gracilibacillus caseinilyticus]UOQ46870.1 AAA family ATPase [Gracilibacillus caseinilyticus]